MKTLFVGNTLFKFNKLKSTNNYCWELLNEKKLPEGTIILSKFQSDGKGQMGKRWISEKGLGLLFSIILYPNELLSYQFYFNKAISLGLCEGLNFFQKSFKIKWPNDIYFNDKKISGILIENGVNKNRFHTSIVGIGINLNQQKFSNDLKNPISLRQIIGEKCESNFVLNKICTFIENRYLQFKSRNFKKIDEDYHSKLYKIGNECSFKRNDLEFKAFFDSVNKSGSIVLKKNGEKSSYPLGELEFFVK